MRLWLTWETQRRNESLARALGCEYARLDHSHANPVARYLRSGYETIGLLNRRRPEVVFTQCPSLALVGVVAAVRRVREFSWVVDAHNHAIERLAAGGVVGKALGQALRLADAVLVSNAALVPVVEAIGARGLVLSDPLPELAAHSPPPWMAAATRPVLVLISSFAADEPIDLFLQAVSAIEAPFTIYVTGRKSKAGSALRWASQRVVFTDFLSQGDYDGLIANADLLIDLTTRPNCLVCGAYEAVAAGVPVLLSDSAALRETFGEGSILASNDFAGYQTAVRTFLATPERYRGAVASFKPRFQARFEEQLSVIEAALSAPRWRAG